jgi:hypothetical protein
MSQTRERPQAVITINDTVQDHGIIVTRVEINPEVGLATEDRYIHLWGGGREVRIGRCRSSKLRICARTSATIRSREGREFLYQVSHKRTVSRSALALTW